jgi:hypothetical protein
MEKHCLQSQSYGGARCNGGTGAGVTQATTDKRQTSAQRDPEGRTILEG